MKKILTVFLAVLMLMQSILVIFADDVSPVFANVTFNDIATNASPEGITVKGSRNCRVLPDGSGKALYLDLSLGIGSVSVPFEMNGDSVWVSAKIKTETILSKANLFTMCSGAAKTTLISKTADGATLTYGKDFAGLKSNVWQEVTVFVDFNAATYDIYIDGIQKVDNWEIGAKIAKSTSVEFEFVPQSDKKTESSVWIDDIRVYGGNSLRRDIPAASMNYEVKRFEEEAADDKITFYKQLDFNSLSAAGIKLYSMQNKNLTHTVKQDDDNNGYYVMSRTSGVGGYHDIEYKSTSYFLVIDFEFCLFENSPDGKMEFFDLRAADQSWNIDFSLTGNVITVKAGGSMTLNYGEWTHFAFAYNLIDHSFDIYRDGILIYENLPMANQNLTDILYSRTSILSTDVPVSFGYDNFYVYEAEAPVENPAEEAAKSLVSQFAGDEKATKEFLGENVVFSVTSGDIYNGEAKKEGVGSGIIENGRTLVPVRTIAEGFGVEVSWDGEKREVDIGGIATLKIGDKNIIAGDRVIESDVAPLIHNERVYLPLRVLAEQVLGKNVLWDEERKMVIMSDGESSINTRDATNMDMAYRYLMYDRMSGEDMINTLKTKSRPRLLVSADRFEEIKKWIKESDVAAGWYEVVKRNADEFLKADVWAYGDRSARMIERDVITLSFMYKMTGEEKYAHRAWRELENIASYKHWNAGASYLNTAAYMLASSVGYDWLYDYLSPGQRKVISDAIVKHGLIEARKDFSGLFGTKSYIRNRDNWTAVCNSSIMMACMAIGDNEEYGELCADVWESAQIALEYIFKGFEPDGGWREGTSYFSFCTIYLQKGLASLDVTFGKTFGYTETPGFAHAGWFPSDMTGTKGLYGSGDGGSTVSNEGFHMMWWSDYFNDPALTAATINIFDRFDREGDVEALLCAKPGFDKTPLSEVPLDTRYRYIEFASLKGNDWGDPDSMWGAFQGGINAFGHGHLDAGSFQFDALGERWAWDLGYDSYDLPEWGASHGKYYCIRAEGHNCIVINPDDSFDQLPSTEVMPITDYGSYGEKGGYAICDLTGVYSHQATSVKRGISMMDGRKSFTVRDEIALSKANSEVYWFMHTTADNIEVFDTYAVLTQNGKKLRVDFLSNADSMEVLTMKAEPLPTSPQYKGTKDYSMYKKLALKVQASGNLNITAKLTPIKDGSENYTVDDTPLSMWSQIAK